ncbi:MAG: TRL domain-containing protein [Gammaproteobacteria bacterium]
MRSILRILGVLAGAALLSGCLYINATYPLDQNMNETKVTGKVGRASRYSVLWAVAWGDGGTQAAARNGGLTIIHNADTQDEVYLFGLWSKRTTIVYGE